jgi:hypothetical protein
LSKVLRKRKIYPLIPPCPAMPSRRAGRTSRRQGGDCEIGVSIENQRFTILTWKTKKIVFHNFYKPAISKIFVLKGGVKDN